MWTGVQERRSPSEGGRAAECGVRVRGFFGPAVRPEAKRVQRR